MAASAQDVADLPQNVTDLSDVPEKLKENLRAAALTQNLALMWKMSHSTKMWQTI